MDKPKGTPARWGSCVRAIKIVLFGLLLSPFICGSCLFGLLYAVSWMSHYSIQQDFHLYPGSKYLGSGYLNSPTIENIFVFWTDADLSTVHSYYEQYTFPFKIAYGTKVFTALHLSDNPQWRKPWYYDVRGLEGGSGNEVREPPKPSEEYQCYSLADSACLNIYLSVPDSDEALNLEDVVGSKAVTWVYKDINTRIQGGTFIEYWYYLDDPSAFSGEIINIK